MRRPHRFARQSLVVALGVIIPAAALHAATYPVRKVVRDDPVQTFGSFLVSDTPVINDDGTVAFRAGTRGGGTFNTPPTSFINWFYPDGTQAKVYLSREDLVSGEHLSLDPSGAVTHLGGALERIAPDGTRTTLAHGEAPNHSSATAFAAPRAAGQGPVAFQALLPDTIRPGIFMGTDPGATRLDDPALQEQPVLAGTGRNGAPRFIANTPDGLGRAVYSGPDPQANLVMDLSRFQNVSAYTENIRGDVLFGATYNGVSGLFTGPDPVADRLNDVPSAVEHFLNDNGQIVVLLPAGTPTGTGFYLLTPSGPDKIIGAGDPLFGSTLQSYQFNRLDQEAFNNRGELAFYYTLSNGENGVAVVTVPEPAALAPLAVGAAAVIAARRRRLRK